MSKFKQMLISNKISALKSWESISMPMDVDDIPRAKETESYQFIRKRNVYFSIYNCKCVFFNLSAWDHSHLNLT